MAVSNKKELFDHIGHKIVVAYYGEAENPKSVCVECETCNMVLYCEEENQESEDGTMEHQPTNEPCLTNGYEGKCVDCPDKNGCYGKNGCYDTDNSEDNQEG